MQRGQETGCERLDPRPLSWEQRDALKRRAIELAHDERARALRDLFRWLWAAARRAASAETRAPQPAAATPHRR